METSSSKISSPKTCQIWPEQKKPSYIPSFVTKEGGGGLQKTHRRNENSLLFNSHKIPKLFFGTDYTMFFVYFYTFSQKGEDIFPFSSSHIRLWFYTHRWKKKRRKKRGWLQQMKKFPSSSFLIYTPSTACQLMHIHGPNVWRKRKKVCYVQTRSSMRNSGSIWTIFCENGISHIYLNSFKKCVE